MTSITIVFRPSTKVGYNQGSLCLRLVHARKARLLTLPCRIYPDEWDGADRKIIDYSVTENRKKYLYMVAQKLDKYIAMIEQTIGELEELGAYDVDDIASRYKLIVNSEYLSRYADRLFDSLYERGQERTAHAYRTATKRLIAFNGDKDILLRHINAPLIKHFEKSLRVEGKTPNTIAFYMRNLRSIYNRAIADRLVVSHTPPFAGVFTGVKKTEKRALKIDEVNKLYELDLLKRIETETDSRLKAYYKQLETAKKYFFFCFNARGMSFVDMSYLRKGDIQNGVLRYYRKKTGQLIEIKMTKWMQQIIDSFAESVKHSEYIFPIITDKCKPERIQYESNLRLQNKRLKKLSKMVNIKYISTHVARHSWATIAKDKNLPLWVISEGLGHSSEKMTYTYLASFDRAVLDHANDVITTAVTRKASLNKNLAIK